MGHGLVRRAIHSPWRTGLVAPGDQHNRLTGGSGLGPGSIEPDYHQWSVGGPPPQAVYLPPHRIAECI